MGNKKTYRDPDPYSEATIKKKRKFPKSNSILMGLCIALQVLLILFAILYRPQPQDTIRQYDITVTPLADGSLEMEYHIVWTALDGDEPLTWIEIGVANPRLSYYSDQLSSTIKRINLVEDGDYTALRLDLDRAYQGGETLELSFVIRQHDMLCEDENGYFYEFVPGWFNATPVERYTFRWISEQAVVSTNADDERDSYYVWEGSMDCGTYVKMDVRYRDTSFAGSQTVRYRPFDDSGVSNDLETDKIAIVVLMILLVVILLVVELNLADSFVSYHRGRGFLRGYGHHVHVYGYVNPRYRTERDLHSASGSGRGGFSGGGCACACACACAGGGRAGCSQKDGYRLKKD